MKLTIGAKTDVGRVREVNEDSYLVQGPLFAIADGMGGHLGGEVASQTAVKVIVDSASEHPPESSEDLERYVRRANESIWHKGSNDPQLKGMGTTCTLLYVEGSTANLAHVGDSRAYLFRQGELSQLTEDHTLVQRMVKEGRLRQEEAAHHPQRNIISRALGVDSDVQVDLLTFELTPGDRVLLNSDGLSSMVSDDVIREVLAETEGADEAAEELVHAALEAGGEDNITVVVLDVERDGAPNTAVAAEPRSTTEPREVSLGQRAGDDVVLDDPHDEDGPTRPRARVGRTVLITLLVLALLAGAAYGATRYALANSWYVGTNDDGLIAIFRGIPDEVAGLNLKEEVEVSSLEASELPPSHRESVLEGIKQDSKEDAETTLENLRELIRDFRDAGSDGGADGGGDGTKKDTSNGGGDN